MQKSKRGKMQPLLLTLILMVTAFWVSPARRPEENVTDPSNW